MHQNWRMIELFWKSFQIAVIFWCNISSSQHWIYKSHVIMLFLSRGTLRITSKHVFNNWKEFWSLKLALLPTYVEQLNVLTRAPNSKFEYFECRTAVDRNIETCWHPCLNTICLLIECFRAKNIFRVFLTYSLMTVPSRCTVTTISWLYWRHEHMTSSCMRITPL